MISAEILADLAQMDMPEDKAHIHDFLHAAYAQAFRCKKG